MRRPAEGGARFRVESSQGVYESKVLACAIGIFGRPSKPKEYRLPPTLKERLLFDMTSQQIQNEAVLVVGGGDSAAEYVQYLRYRIIALRFHIERQISRDSISRTMMRF